MTIKELRIQKNMTQRELADAIGVDVSIISKYESGTVTPPIKRLEAIAYVLDTEFGQIQIDVNKPTVEHLHMYKKLLTPYHNSYLRRMILLGANGHCELCHQPAPFVNKDGRPYLLIYDIEKNYAGETPEKNLIALCPNCHAKITVLQDTNDVCAIQEIAKNHNY